MTRDTPVPTWQSRLTVGLALVILLFVALFVRRHFFMGVVGVDNFDYVTLAHSIARGVPLFGMDPIPSSFHLPRLALVLPMAAIFATVGPGQFPAAAWPMTCSLASVIVAFLLGRHVGGLRTGLIAATVLTIHPLEALYAGTPLPDAVVSLFGGLAVYLFVLALDVDGRRAALAFAGSGVALGVAYYARPNTLVVVAVGLAWLLWMRLRPTRAMALVPIGGLAMLLLGSAFVVSRGGPPWFEITHFIRLQRETQIELTKYGHLEFPLFHYWNLLTGPLLGPTTLLLGASALVLLVLRDRRLALLAIWLGLLYLYFEIGSQYPTVSIVLKEERYLTPLALPTALTIGLAGDRALGLLPRPTWQLAAGGVFAVLVGLWSLPGLQVAGRFAGAQRSGPAWAPREAGVALRQLPPLPTYVTRDWLAHLNFFTLYRSGLDTLDPSTFATARLKRVQFEADSNRPRGVGRGYVVHDERFSIAVPPDWVLVERRRPSVAIYYAPDPTLPDSSRFEMALGAHLELSADLTAENVGLIVESDRALVAIDWTTRQAAPNARVGLQLRDAAGVVLGAAEAPLFERALPTRHWIPGGLYRVYHQVPLAAVSTGLPALWLGVDGQAPRMVPVAAPPTDAPRIEMERFEGVLPVRQQDLPTLVGWGAYPQAFYAGGQAGIARQPGARARAGTPNPGLPRVWLRVFSYDAATNVVQVSLDGEQRPATWRSGAPGMGWIALEFPRGGRGVEVELDQLGQRYAIVDQLALAAG